jgi:pyruvate ferredoxin oxidoreductase gamma subunit/2-oxoisovalerate ferredoxin oxidoreductase gamma subunit
MIEIRFHGRGGQGAVVASELLAHAAFLEGKQPQSFPSFGVERRGAPVAAFCRIDDRPVLLRTQVTDPDIVVVLDAGLLRTVHVTAGLKPGGLLLVNTERPPRDLPAGAGGTLAAVDATGIAVRHGLGSRTTPIVNTAILGALSRASGVVRIGSVLHAIRAHVPAKPGENVEAAREAYERVAVLQAVVA